MKEDIKILKGFTRFQMLPYKIPMSKEGFENFKKAIKNILNELERLQKENESKQKAYDDCYCEYKHYKQFDSIPKQVIRDKLEEIENSGIWVTEDCFFDGETDNLICQQEFKKYEMEEYIINLLRKLLGDE